MSDIKRFYAPGLDCLYRSNKDAPRELIALVLEADYAKLEAENARLNGLLLELTTRHFAESWSKRSNDKQLEEYLSLGIAQLEAEAQALREEVAALRARVAVVPERKAVPEYASQPMMHCGATGWNACLDKLARLNGKAVSEGVLRRIDESMCDYLGEDDPLRLELSALLDEGKEVGDA